MPESPLLLRNATVQEIQLELIRRTLPGWVDGERIVTDLLTHRDLWEAAMLDRFCFSNPGKLPRTGLIKLRDLPENFWNADTLYVLTPTVEHARALLPLAEEWGGMQLIEPLKFNGSVVSAAGCASFSNRANHPPATARLRMNPSMA
ncbi:MAG: hypothetical protein KDE19_21320 [Caldilineaceae bacterium]|nr:hypothetical protein [Caldilineaceae bacterium]